MQVLKSLTRDHPADGRLWCDRGGELPRPRRRDLPYRLVAVDLDGTLLDPAHRISPANRRAVQDCLDRGIRVVLASGRLFASMRPHCRSLRLVGPQITLNGAIIADADSGASSAVAGLTAEAVAAAAGALTAAGLPFVIFGRVGICTPSHGAHCDLLVEYGEPRPLVVPALDGRSIPDPIKVVTFVAEGSSAERGVRSAMRGRLDVVRTGPQFLELMAPGVTKGAALARLMTAAGVPRGEVLAIGDNFNDLSMFAVAGLGVAMANAPRVVRESAGAVTADCASDGVAAALRRYVLDGASAPGRGMGSTTRNGRAGTCRPWSSTVPGIGSSRWPGAN